MKVVLQVYELEIHFTLQATFYDLNDKLTYSIIDNSMSVTDDSLQYMEDRNPFKISGDQLQLNFDVQDSNMRGMFVFNVLVKNLGQFLQYWLLVST
jgi:GH43 family beta-xylosidase